MPTTLPVAVPEADTEKEEQLSPPYCVILFDDDAHSYAYVVEMVMVLFAMSARQGFDIAYEVDHIGQAVVLKVPYEEALEAYQKIISYGPDHRMANSKGSMSATIEPAE